jgi:hypothetical protein
MAVTRVRRLMTGCSRSTTRYYVPQKQQAKTALAVSDRIWPRKNSKASDARFLRLGLRWRVPGLLMALSFRGNGHSGPRL